MEQAHTPSQICEKVGAFLKGKGINEETKLEYNVGAAMHYSARNKIYGPPDKDANNLSTLVKSIKENFPLSLCETLTQKLDDNTEKLQNFVFSTQNMKSLFQSFHDVVLIDSTYKTNKFRMPLLVIAGISEEAKTFMFGFAALSSEAECNVKWALEKIFGFLGQNPNIICTDSCPTLKKVLTVVTPKSTHLLCGWHIDQNIIKHLGPVRKN